MLSEAENIVFESQKISIKKPVEKSEAENSSEPFVNALKLTDVVARQCPHRRVRCYR